MQMRASLSVDDEAAAAGVDITLSQDIGREHHQVSFKGLRRVLAGRSDDIWTKGEVGNELAIHDVPLEQVDASGIKCLNFGTQL